MTRRILAIAVAILLAGLGAGGVLLYALSADERARSSIDGVNVVIATKRIPQGTSAERIRDGQMVRMETMPRSSVPADALAEIKPAQEGLVLRSTVEPGQLLLAAMFAPQTAVTSGLSLPDGTMAVTVETGVPEQVAGYVRPGARVAIFLTYKLLDDKLSETRIQRTRVLLPSVEVVTTGTYQPPRRSGANSEAEPSTGSGAMLVTVAVNQDQAERLIEGLNTGKLYLGLLTDAIQVVPGPGVDNMDRSAGRPLFR
jgi:pilus assembly protein CpaB